MVRFIAGATAGAFRANACALIASVALFSSASANPPATSGATEASSLDAEIVITLAGDTGLNGSHQLVHATFGTKQGKRLAWANATSAITREIRGDMVFGNLETVVTDRNDLQPTLKLFAFRTHPDAVRHLAEIGFNAFSTANNHAMDFGADGARETLRHLDRIGVPHAGLGLNRAGARAPRLIPVGDRRIAFSAIGIGGNAYSQPTESENRPGQLTYSEADINESVAALAAAQTDYRVLSIHYGQEFEVTTSAADRARLKRALAQGADLVVGHHHHVVAGIEIVGGKPIFYGLGNFLHWGTQDMSRFDICRDYGLIARVHLGAAKAQKPMVRAIEAIPITAMHSTPRRMSVGDAQARLHVLNHLAGQFAADGVRFAMEEDGTGLYCAPETQTLATALARRCRAATLQPPPAELQTRIKAACSRRVVRIVEHEDGLEPEFAPASTDGQPLTEWP